jgi:hypothetical protein
MNTIDIAGFQHHETKAAILFSINDEETDASWLPKSQIDVYPDGKHERAVIVRMPNWLAREKGLI